MSQIKTAMPLDICCLNWKGLFAYLRKHFGQESVVALTEKLVNNPAYLLQDKNDPRVIRPITLTDLEDPSYWVSNEFSLQMLGNVNKVVPYADPLRVAGEGAVLERLSSKELVISRIVGPMVLAKKAAKINSLFNNTKSVTLAELEKGKVRYQLCYRPGYRVTADVCHWNLGIYIGMVKACGCRVGSATETKCVLRGDSCCEFEIIWTQPALFQRLLRWVLLRELGGVIEQFDNIIDDKHRLISRLSQEIAIKQMAQESLAESEERYRQLFETNQAIKLIIDPSDGSIVDANRAACEYYGYSRGELTAMKVFDINASPSEEVQARMALVQAQQSVKFSIQHRLASGEIRDVEVYSGPLKSGDKTLLHGIVFDVTDRNRAEEASRQSQERFRLAFDTSPDSININRLSDGLYVDINQGFTALTGFTRADAIGRTSLEINVWHDPADRQRLVKGLREKGSVENLEAQFRRKDGSLLTALMSARIIILDGEPHLLSITRDISERIKSEQEKEHLKAQLHQAQKMEAIGTLAGGIAHDFNNILAAIMGFAELAQEDAKSGQPNPQHLTHILASAQRAKELVQRILTFSRKKEPDLQPLDLNHIVRRAQAMLERTLPKMIGIEAQLAPDLPPILADPTQMEQVLLNLASNARDAMPEGGRLTLETQRLILDQEYCRQHLEVLPGPYVMLRVSDTGLGMDKQTREHIFEPFYTTKDIGKGTGLGLSSAYGIIKNHGGHLDCQSQVGTGTTFIIHLPAMTEQDGGAPLDMNPVAPLGLRGTESILLVDDEADLRELGARTLGAMGYQVRTADSGEEALEMYRQMGGQLDLVILDLGMPGMGGHKAMQAILELNPQAKVIIASGYSINGKARGIHEDGAAGYVAKPFLRAELLTTVRKVLDVK